MTYILVMMFVLTFCKLHNDFIKAVDKVNKDKNQ